MPIDYADYHRIALLTGCETVDDAIRWADSEIARIRTSPVSLIDVSLGKSRSVPEIAALLNSLVVNPNDCSALHAVLAQISEMVRDDHLRADDAIDRIYKYAKTHDPRGDLRLAFISIAEDLSCLRDGVYWTNDATTLREPLIQTINRFCSAKANADDRTKP